MTEKTFTLNVELLHLAIELATSEAVRIEAQRQFSEQFPGMALQIDDADVRIPGIEPERIRLNVPGWKVELR